MLPFYDAPAIVRWTPPGERQETCMTILDGKTAIVVRPAKYIDP